METPFRHHSVEAEGTCVSIHKQSSAGNWKQQQIPKAPATEDGAVTVRLQVETDEPKHSGLEGGLRSIPLRK